MTSRRGYRFIYSRLVAPLGEDARLEVDALLGDAAAVAERDRRRRDTVLAVGVELA